ncbi:hypothetical protein KIPB_006278 [Kipferlia bialata]|uniref:GBD/FH3 domain-containing protein n=1 Tax=Kipferlia bialata TaxID=797122 RepID=A0A9K3CWT2_9EUKA|nr:hypothetical protein KIPB_006278 [Kipferlia bialata]|eukprot:g6278.t1
MDGFRGLFRKDKKPTAPTRSAPPPPVPAAEDVPMPEEEELNRLFKMVLEARGMPAPTMASMLSTFPNDKKWMMVQQSDAIIKSQQQEKAAGQVQNSPKYLISILNAEFSLQNVQTLRSLLMSKPIDWLIEFIENEGPALLLRLIRVVDNRMDDTAAKKKEGHKMRFELLKCLWGCMNNGHGMKAVIDLPNSVNIIALSLDCEFRDVQQHTLQLLSVICSVPDGFGLVMDAISNFSFIKRIKDRLQPLGAIASSVQDGTDVNEVSTLLNLFILINSLLNYSPSVEKRCDMREEFIRHSTPGMVENWHGLADQYLSGKPSMDDADFSKLPPDSQKLVDQYHKLVSHLSIFAEQAEDDEAEIVELHDMGVESMDAEALTTMLLERMDGDEAREHFAAVLRNTLLFTRSEAVSTQCMEALAGFSARLLDHKDDLEDGAGKALLSIQPGQVLADMGSLPPAELVEKLGGMLGISVPEAMRRAAPAPTPEADSEGEAEGKPAPVLEIVGAEAIATLRRKAEEADREKRAADRLRADLTDMRRQLVEARGSMMAGGAPPAPGGQAMPPPPGVYATPTGWYVYATPSRRAIHAPTTWWNGYAPSPWRSENAPSPRRYVYASPSWRTVYAGSPWCVDASPSRGYGHAPSPRLRWQHTFHASTPRHGYAPSPRRHAFSTWYASPTRHAGPTWNASPTRYACASWDALSTWYGRRPPSPSGFRSSPTPTRHGCTPTSPWNGSSPPSPWNGCPTSPSRHGRSTPSPTWNGRSPSTPRWHGYPHGPCCA